MAKPLTKTQKILSFLKTPKTSARLKAKFGVCKSLLKALRTAGCITSARHAAPAAAWPQAWGALYTATGKPYEAKRGRPLSHSPAAAGNSERYRLWAKKNKAHRKEYQRVYRLAKAAAAKQAKL